MNTYSRLLVAFLLFTMVGCGKSSEQKMANPKDEIATAEDLSKIQIRGELGYLPNSDEPHTGWLKKLHNGSEQVHCLLKLDEGKPSDIRIWYANGNPYFVAGLGEVTNLEDLIEEIEQLTSASRKIRAVEEAPNGLITMWYENGQKQAEGRYKNGERDGLFTGWYENGQKSSEGHSKNGKQDGLWTRWYENGRKKQEWHYENGKLDSASVWKPDGKPCPITKIVNGSGIVVVYRENGQKEREYHYKDGKMKSEYRYKNGKRVR